MVKHKHSRRFLECAENYFLVQVINESTSEVALLDLLLTNKEESDRDVEIKSSLGHSNHEIVEFKVLRKVRKTNSTVYSARPSTYSYNRALQESRFQLVQGSSWQNLMEDDHGG